ncbi:MAG: histidine kinase [Fluviicola sp.]
MPFYYRIGEEEFANVNVFSLLFDSNEEILYAATNSGVYYYAQSKFHRIPADKVAKGNSYFSLQQDSQGRIYCMNLQGQIFQVQIEGLKHCFNYPKDALNEHFRYILNKDDHIVCLGNKIIEYQKNETSFSSKVLAENTYVVSNIKQLQSGRYILGRYSKHGSNKFDIQYNGTKDQFIELNGRIAMQISDNIYSFIPGTINGEKGVLNRYDEHGTIIEQAPLLIGDENYKQISDSSYVIMNRRSGLIFGSHDGQHHSQSETFFNTEFISDVYQSDRGAVFLGTFKEGVIVIPSMSFRGYESQDLHTAIRDYDEDYFLVSNRNGRILAYAKDGSGTELVFESKRNQDAMVLSSTFTKTDDPWWKLAKISDLSASGAISLGQGDIAMLARNGILVRSYNPTESYYRELVEEKNKKGDLFIRVDGRYNALAADKKNKVIYASKLGELFRFDYFGNNLKRMAKDTEMNVWSLHYADNRLYCGTETRGIYVFENDVLIDTINYRDGLYKTQVRKMQKSGDFLYISTTSGFQIFNLSTHQFIPFGIAKNLLDRKVIDFDATKHDLFILRKKDHYIVPLNKLNEKIAPSRIYVDSVIINGRKIDYKNHEFSYDENSVVFFVDYRDFLTKEKTAIQYKLDGFYDDWRSLPNGAHEIEFQSLPVGTYTFRVRAAFQGEYSKEFVYTFTISPPFWQTWWFYALIVVVTILLIGSIAILGVRRIRTKSRQKLELESSKSVALNAQLKAIRAQMNPHFVFNSINSIQDLVLKKETLKSYDYLESFSRLVRMTLEHSEREFVLLNEEREFLQLYLDLESLRFSDEFEYNLAFQPELGGQKVPSLMIQPFVENAIKHGLLHKQGMKKLTINFERIDESYIRCTITDNGIGRKRSKEILSRRNQEHKSFSTEAIATRITMLSNQFKDNFHFEVIDLQDENGNVQGTQVILQFPFVQMA